MNSVVYAIGSVFFVSLISLIGILTLKVKDDVMKKVLIYFISFSAGSMLGGAFFHMLPEVIEMNEGFVMSISIFILFGILISFFLEKVIHWRHCHMPITKTHVHHFGIMSLVGDIVHNFLDGIIIGVSYLASIPTGVATTIAVVFHEIPQEIADFGVLLHSGFSKKKALGLNFFVGIFAFIGLGISFVIGAAAQDLIKFIIPIAIGNFIYIAGADLIPEMHKDTKISKSLMQIIMFVLGVVLMYLLTFMG